MSGSLERPTSYVLAGRVFTHAEWESLCTGCGLCCYEKVLVGGRVVPGPVPCEHLTADNLCRVYETRFDACADCVKVTPEVVRQGGVLPDGCPYVELWLDLEEEEAQRGPAAHLPQRGRGGGPGRRGGRRA